MQGDVVLFAQTPACAWQLKFQCHLELESGTLKPYTQPCNQGVCLPVLIVCGCRRVRRGKVWTALRLSWWLGSLQLR
jgi:hypothetical protein